ncbi:hypothetical protein GCM10007973_25050 [Polymorphobacter multimanifer]|nr:hypothetical protein GCM10007973_25050 [Polymorphobacter multimanifer]
MQRLVILGIAVIDRALRGDIRRQRHHPRRHHRRLNAIIGLEAPQHRPLGAHLLLLARQSGPEIHPARPRQPPHILYKRPPARRPLALVPRHSHRRLPPPPPELRRDHPRIIHHQHITRLQPRRQIAHHKVGKPAVAHFEHPRRIPGRYGPQCNPFGRQFKVEITHKHGAALR